MLVFPNHQIPATMALYKYTLTKIVLFTLEKLQFPLNFFSYQTMAALTNSLVILSLVVVLSFSSTQTSLAARHLFQTMPPIPTLPKTTLPPLPAMPTLPTATLPPPLPTMPTLPKPTLPPLPSTQIPSSLPIPTLPTMPAVPKVTLPPLPATSLPTFPAIPSIPTTMPAIPFLSPPPSN